MKHQKKGKLLTTGIATALTVSLATAFFGAPDDTSTANVARQLAPSAMTFTFGDERATVSAASVESAQPATSNTITAPANLEVEADGKVIVKADRSTKGISMVSAERGGDLYPQGKGLAPADKAAAFLNRHGDLFGINDVANELRIIGMKGDQFGNTRVTFQQMLGDVPVFGAVMHSHVGPDGSLQSVNGKFIPDLNVAATPSINPDYAAHSAVSAVSRQLPVSVKGADLTVASNSVLIYRENLTKGAPGQNHLAYEVEVTSGHSIREFVYVDAVTGKIVDQITGIHGLKQREVYAASYQGDGSPTLVYQDGHAVLGNRPAGNQLSHEDEVAGAGESYNFFFNLSNGTYRSYDGMDAVMRTVDTDPTIVCPNANWNGTSTNYCLGTSSDDVVTHEWGHAYTQYTSGLIYAWQSGALNESYSDIFGETVDLINNRELRANDPRRVATGGNDGPRMAGCSAWGSDNELGDQSYRWLMGEDAYVFAALPPVGDGAIRDMWTPSCFGDADYVNSDEYTCGAGDAGGVHSNSSINNRAFALLVDGDTVTNSTTTVTVNAIGLTKAAHIFYRANSEYNTPSSNFADNADNLELACSTLVGEPLTALVSSVEDGTGTNPGHEGENDDTVDPTPETWDGISILDGVTNHGDTITASDCDAVAAAIEAVEMRFDVTEKCRFTPMFEEAPAPMCFGETVQPIWSEDWEGGQGDWTTGQAGVTKTTLDTVEWYLRNDANIPADRPSTNYYEGGNVMYQENRRDLGNCTTDDESGTLFLDSPPITVHPTDTSFVSIEQYVNSELNYDGGNIMISRNGEAFQLVPDSAFVHNGYSGALDGSAENTNPKRGQAAWTGGNFGDTQGDWGQSQIDLAAAGVQPGDSIVLRFDFGQDGCNGNDGWYVDDIEVFACAGGPPPPPQNCEVFDADTSILGGNNNVITGGVPSVTTVTVSGETEDFIVNPTDINIRSLKGSHPYMGDLIFDLVGPGGTAPTYTPLLGTVVTPGTNSVNLFNGAAAGCAGETGINVEFDDDADTAVDCLSWNSGLAFQSSEALSAFNGTDGNGTWTLQVTDVYPVLDDGAIDGWELEFCGEPEVRTVYTAPIAVDDSETTDQDSSVTVDVVDNDSDLDPEDTTLTVISASDPANGTTFLTEDNMVSYVPDAGYCNYDEDTGMNTGADTFTYTIDDGSGAPDAADRQATAEVSITVNCVDEGDLVDDVKGDGKLKSLHIDNDDDSDSDSDSDKHEIKFHFDPKRKKNNELKGHLHLTDKEADVKIHMKEITYLGPVQGNCGMIDNGDDGTYIFEFRGIGKFEQGDSKVEDAEFRACAVDADDLKAKKDDGETEKGGDNDRFRLACTSGCSYTTDTRIDSDDVLDKGDVRVKKAANLD
ncbi:MAG: M4 family metallopeptidase [Woeseia sp.]|nr:M4 family metallopeptidase [Woeseia sp.]MBT8097622.1 M4 family metallopeptidase [Woeseia sp.]